MLQQQLAMGSKPIASISALSQSALQQEKAEVLTG
jgi:hypothetical protein